jgi:hypothetical protein
MHNCFRSDPISICTYVLLFLTCHFNNIKTLMLSSLDTIIYLNRYSYIYRKYGIAGLRVTQREERVQHFAVFAYASCDLYDFTWGGR